MSNDIHIKDDGSLYDLNNTLEYTADSLLKIEESVESYFGGVLDSLGKQLDILREQLEQAQEELAAAESALSSCEASQTWDDEDECYRPSCDWEAAAVREAGEVVGECQRKYDAGAEIVRKCQSEWETYHKTYSSFLSPPGGHYYVDHAANTHTDAATEKIREIIEINSRYLHASFGDSTGEQNRVVDPSHVRSENIPLTKEQQQRRREEVVERVNREQSSPRVDANRVMVCPQCGRPLSMCVCPRKRENMEILKKGNDA